jgi:hypothetical protein
MKKETSKPLVIVLIIIIIFSAAFIMRQYGRIQHFQAISLLKQTLNKKIAQYHGKLNAQNVDLISSWMTFDYVNKIFNLPADYLKSALAISDAGYPRIPISRYEKNHKLDAVQFLAEVKNTVADYFKK